MLRPENRWFPRCESNDVEMKGDGQQKGNDGEDFASSGASPGDDDGADVMTQSSARSSTRSEATKGPARRERQLLRAMAHQGVQQKEGESLEDAAKRFRTAAAAGAISGMDVDAGANASQIYNLLIAAMAAAPRYDIMKMWRAQFTPADKVCFPQDSNDIMECPAKEPQEEPQPEPRPERKDEPMEVESEPPAPTSPVESSPTSPPPAAAIPPMPELKPLLQSVSVAPAPQPVQAQAQAPPPPPPAQTAQTAQAAQAVQAAQFVAAQMAAIVMNQMAAMAMTQMVNFKAPQAVHVAAGAPPPPPPPPSSSGGLQLTSRKDYFLNEMRKELSVAQKCVMCDKEMGWGHTTSKGHVAKELEALSLDLLAGQKASRSILRPLTPVCSKPLTGDLIQEAMLAQWGRELGPAFEARATEIIRSRGFVCGRTRVKPEQARGYHCRLAVVDYSGQGKYSTETRCIPWIAVPRMCPGGVDPPNSGGGGSSTDPLPPSQGVPRPATSWSPVDMGVLTSGQWWPVAIVVQNDTTMEFLATNGIQTMVVCIYQLGYDEPQAWWVPLTPIRQARL